MKNKIRDILKTKIIGKKIKYYEKIDSTQLVAKEMAEKKVENGTIVITDNQENGIGTHDRKWYSEAGKNIMFTVIIYPKCNIKNLNTITVDIAKCIVITIEKIYHLKLEIKHPNDIMCNGKKLGGILTQIVTNGEDIRYLLIGIGINVNQDKFDGEIKQTATSLKIELGKMGESTRIKEKIENGKNDLVEGNDKEEGKNKIEEKSRIKGNNKIEKLGEQELDRAKIVAEFCNIFEEYCKRKEIL